MRENRAKAIMYAQKYRLGRNETSCNRRKHRERPTDKGKEAGVRGRKRERGTIKERLSETDRQTYTDTDGQIGFSKHLSKRDCQRQTGRHILTQTDRQASVNTYHKFLKLRIELIFICWHGNVHSDWFQWGVIVGAKLNLGWTPATQAPAQPPSTRHLGRVLLTPVP